jgi:hypothetical protein
MITQASSEPNIFQVISWQAAAVGALIGALIAIIQLAFGVVRQSRESRIARARFGYELLDSMFNDEWASEFLYSLDVDRSVIPTHGAPDVGTAFIAVFSGGDISVPERHQTHMYRCLDAFLYFADRFEHAIRAKLTTFDTLAMPTGYYVRLLTPYRSGLRAYIKRVGYDRVLAFLSRFPAWASGESLTKAA